MNVTIFGATGSIGRNLTQQAIDAGHNVTAFARTPSKLGIEHANLTLMQGNVLEAAAVEQAVIGQDIVLVALGAGRKGGVRSEGTRNIINAMEKHNVSRLICQTSLGVGDSSETLTFWWKYIMFGLLLRKAFADHILQEQYIQQSNLDWTIVRPAAFTDGELTGDYQHGFASNAKNLALKISRADVADFMLKQFGSNQYLHMTPGLSY